MCASKFPNALSDGVLNQSRVVDGKCRPANGEQKGGIGVLVSRRQVRRDLVPKHSVLLSMRILAAEVYRRSFDFDCEHPRSSDVERESSQLSSYHIDIDNRPVRAFITVQIETIHRFQCCFGHSNRTRCQGLSPSGSNYPPFYLAWSSHVLMLYLLPRAQIP